MSEWLEGGLEDRRIPGSHCRAQQRLMNVGEQGQGWGSPTLVGSKTLSTQMQKEGHSSELSDAISGSVPGFASFVGSLQRGFQGAGQAGHCHLAAGNPACLSLC